MDIFVEIITDIFGRLVQGFDRADQRGLVVQRLTGIGDEYGRDTQGVVYDKRR